MKLLLDEMYTAVIAEQLRRRGHDVVSIHESDYQWLEGVSDREVCAAALAESRANVTENVPDFRRLEADALARGEPHPAFIFTTDRQFSRGAPATLGRLIVALDAFLREEPAMVTVFLRPRSDEAARAEEQSSPSCPASSVGERSIRGDAAS